MRSEQVRKHWKKQPFEPFRIFLSDGAHYDVPHPDFGMVSARLVVVGIDGNGADMPGDFAFCDPVHITRIEPIRNDRKRSTRKPGNKRD